MAAIKRISNAVWKGTGLEGSGTLSSTSGVLNETPYSFAARFVSEDGKAGTNPEELIGAAHAGCFSMALSFQLTGAGFPPTQLATKATVEMEKGDAGFRVSAIKLAVEGTVPGISEEKFLELAGVAKANCPISQALAAVPITLDAKLV
ncbi:OsmC family protein [Runella aurantiaca]|uniref:OsmC family peroxiredoxin n=1 Tax=Runella aurantiaca TaxID=2282308 RepID=A0A369IIP8_9BACT|nr:OsmC family protein [Runella aurantiaca]RDB08045.1 OsmC family peroxiredoxin [Runella aurantiaca]